MVLRQSRTQSQQSVINDTDREDNTLFRPQKKSYPSKTKSLQSSNNKTVMTRY